MPFPNIDPVIFELGPFAIRWYSLAYIIGLMAGWKYIARLNRTPALWSKGALPNGLTTPAKEDDIDDMLLWLTLGVILGGRLGYVLFYNTSYYLANPGDALAVWQGGMSFHGGALGVIISVLIFARKRGIPLLALGDMVAITTPLGLGLGRLANFINSELWGRVSDVPWAVVFPNGGPLPRHPSQLYEAALEGLLLLLVLNILAWKFKALSKPGLLTGLFLIGYGASRAFVEFFREPDAHLGFLFDAITMGQILSLPMIGAGIGFVYWALAKARAE
ncbi:MAG: prolipoprotein diacylglyceryl transferase [Alphaproteobacteria bacterium]|nr:prolipoprotein diacylglyceryl transferase [Alphaproteobacteria bacterium]